MGCFDNKPGDPVVKCCGQLFIAIVDQNGKPFSRNIKIQAENASGDTCTKVAKYAGTYDKNNPTVAYFGKIPTGSYKAKIVDEEYQAHEINIAVGPDKKTNRKSPNTTLKVEEVVRAHLKFQFLDPEKTKRLLPKNFPVTVCLEATKDNLSGESKLEAMLNKEGLLIGPDGHPGFQYDPAKNKTFSLEFPTDTGAFIICEKQGDEKKSEFIKSPDTEHSKGKSVGDKLIAGNRAFRLPDQKWNLKMSQWEITGGGYKKTEAIFTDLEKQKTSIAPKDTPIELVLKPHWQYLKFVHYDRKLKGNKPLSLPSKSDGNQVPLVIDGWRKKSEESAGKKPSAQCHWAIGGDETQLVQCLPWIVGLDESNSDEKMKLSSDSILRFKRNESHPFIFTEESGERKFLNLTDANVRDKPSVERLSYYDLPKVWKSRGYFTWQSDTDSEFGPYEDVAEKETTKDKPLLFSLDDIVLTDDTLAAVTPWSNSNRVALFGHTFETSGAEPADTGPSGAVAAGKPQIPTPSGRRWQAYQGLYNPDTANKKGYFSKIKMEVNYIADYPHWTRLVAFGGNLYDTFDQRTPEHASDVVGARAAVRWVDATTGQPANSVVSPRPGRTDKAFCSIQPLLEQEHPQRFAQIPYDHNAPSTVRLGRFDFALLRCCDVVDSVEKAVNLIYFKMNFNCTSASLNTQDKKDKYGEDFVNNVARRWNGDDGLAPASRLKFLPQNSPAEPVTLDHVWFGQSLPVDQSQFKCDVTDGGGRSWFDGTNGRGELTPKGGADEPSGAFNWFVGAHECGHGVGLNDDYSERWSAQSLGQLSFRWHLPGDPYEPDGRIVEFHKPGAAMMNGNQEIRNRYVWHCAEWVRAIIGTPLKVKLGNDYPDYQVPPHATDGRSYAFWPIASKKSFEPDAADNRGMFHIDLYTLGADRYAKDVLPDLANSVGKDCDGILMISVNLQCDIKLANKAQMKLAASTLAKVIRDQNDGMNSRFYCTGKLNEGSANAWEFKRCLIHFQPRFCIISDPTPGETAKATALANAMGIHHKIQIDFHNAATGPMKTRWMPSEAEVAEIMPLNDWKNGTEASAGPRAPADAELDTIDTLLTEYHAIHEVELDARQTKLQAIIDATEAWLSQGHSLLGDLFEDEPPNRPTRQAGVNALKTAAEARLSYYKKIRKSREVIFDGTSYLDYENMFSLYFPSMFGIYKTCPDITTVDLKTLVSKVIPGSEIKDA
ncbi:MAG: hypothetical protein L3J28_12095 [Candidatus Polarisedimenticolaceae bacterium]|nr:hypothetical protein [Candidatus Polarisedimenticolaceae bacterium]